MRRRKAVVSRCCQKQAISREDEILRSGVKGLDSVRGEE
jgi:hypothetical protein